MNAIEIAREKCPDLREAFDHIQELRNSIVDAFQALSETAATPPTPEFRDEFLAGARGLIEAFRGCVEDLEKCVAKAEGK